MPEQQPKRAKYKIFDQTLNDNAGAWVQYYLETSAAQVLMTESRHLITINTKVNGRSFALSTATVEGVPNTPVENATIFGQDITVVDTSDPNGTPIDSYTLTTIHKTDSVAVALAELDVAAQAAYDHVPENCLTYDYVHDNVTTPGNFDDIYANLQAIENLGADTSNTWGFLKKTAANTWELNTSVVTSVNGQSPSNSANGAVIIYADKIRMDSSYPDNTATVKSEINNLEETIAGKTFSYVINDAVPSSVVMPQEVNGWVNSAFANTQSQITITVNTSSSDADALYLYTDTNNNVRYISLFELRPGDTIFVKEPNVPDRWLADRYTTDLGTTFVFYILETSSLAWSAITDTPTTLAGYGVTAPEAATFKAIASGSNNNTVIKPSQIEVQTGSASAKVFTWPDAGGIIATRSWADGKYVPINGLSGGTGVNTGLAKLQLDVYSSPGISIEEGVGSLYLKAGSKAAQYYADKIAITTNANASSPTFVNLILPTTAGTLATQEWVTNSSSVRNTTDATNLVTTKLYLVGAQNQSTAQQTSSNVNVYIGTDNCLYSNNKRVPNTVVAVRTDTNTDTPSGYTNPHTGDIWVDITA